MALELIAFSLMVLGSKKKSLMVISMVSFLVVLGVSMYYYQVDNVYAFVSEYYVYSSLIGFLAASVLFLRVRKKWTAH